MAPTETQRPEPGDSALELAAEIWQRRRAPALIVLATALAAVVGVVIALPDIYRGTALVLVDPGAIEDAVVRMPVNGKLEPRLYTVSKMVLSRNGLQRVINRFNLYPELRKRASPQVVIDRMRRDIKLERTGVDAPWGQGTTVAVSLSYQGWDPNVVADVANLLAEHYIEENNRIRRQQAAQAAAFLRRQAEAAERELDAQQKQVRDFKSRHIGELPEQQQANLTILERLNAQLKMNSDNLARAADERDELLKQLAASGSTDDTERLAQLKMELGQLRTRYSDLFPDVQRVKAEIATLERRLRENPPSRDTVPLGRVRQRLHEAEAELDTLRDEQRRLRAAAVAYQDRVERAPHRAQELAALAQGLDSAKELHASLLKRYEEAQLADTLERSGEEQFRILEPAVPPALPVGPARLRLLVMGLVLSLLAAAGVVVLAEQIDTSFHTADELRSFTRVPVLASIPPILTAGDFWRARLRRGLIAAATAVAVIGVGAAAYAAGASNYQLVWLLAQRGS